MKVAVGGTFEPLHDGHKALLEKAFSLGCEVVIGVTSDEMARKRVRSVLPFEIRAENLRRYVKRRFGVEPKIMKLNDKYGDVVEGDYRYIVVSPETYPVALEINERREKKGKNPVEIILVPHVLAEDGEPISSTRIKKGIIDVHGKLL
ncbi:MAG: pantetheine-phosphate adenylyltransferase [Archaeoglobi archaeon]|nr:phosphopantetheine adenylyltransferase [Candidatus Mnemosynella bozhongmuii]MDK2781162.1 pantetheine-phosphate adenylyltransferase [Archaeoglobi archaeon]